MAGIGFEDDPADVISRYILSVNATVPTGEVYYVHTSDDRVSSHDTG